jgi:16S rRNA (cytosine1402-N4)-methyltransferase
VKRDVRHVPVLLSEVLAALEPQPGQTIVDCTLGLGGHARELFHRIQPAGTLMAIDFDASNIDTARPLLPGASLHHNNFAALPQILAGEGIEQVEAILADVGIASPQIDDPGRGFSYRRDGPLDMRMDPTRGKTASQLINSMCERDIVDALLELGDETDAAKIARLIIEHRKRHPIETTAQLTKLICDARDFTLKRAAGAKLHPAARTFQALRMLVNRELPNLQRLLDVAPQCLKPGGRIAIISFHSGEDRLVKRSFRELHREGVYGRITVEPIIANEAEIRANPRSRSAKLRWAQRS